MKNFLILLLPLITFVNTATSQTWCKTIESDSADIVPYSLIQVEDGSYFITGSYAIKDKDEDLFIAKTNAQGDLIWTKTIGGPQADKGHAFASSGDGGVVIAASTYTYGEVAYTNMIIKIDSLGTIQWSKSIIGLGYQSFSSMIRSGDGGYVLTGNTRKASGQDIFYRIFTVKLDNSGSIQWTRMIGEKNDAGYAIIQTRDGGYAIAGIKTNSSSDLYITKLDGSGDLQWTRTVGGTRDDVGYDIIQADDGMYYVVGQTNSFGLSLSRNDLLIVKLNEAGNLVWSHTINDQLSWIIGRKVIQAHTGKIMTLGYQKTGMETRMHLAKVDQDGNIYMRKTFGINDTLSSTGSNIINTADGGFAIVGATDLANDYNHTGILFIKLDSNCNVCPGCGQWEGLGSVEEHGESGIGGTIWGGGTEGTCIFSTGTGGTMNNICYTNAIIPIQRNEYIFIGFPSPFSDMISFRYNLEISVKYKLEFFNNTGTMVFTDCFVPDRKTGTLSKFLPSLSSGLYLVRLSKVSDAKTIATLRLIKQ